MTRSLAVFFSIVALFFGIRLTWLVSEAAHYLSHQGAFDSSIGFVLIFIAPWPFLVCLLLSVSVWFRAGPKEDDYP